MKTAVQVMGNISIHIHSIQIIGNNGIYLYNTTSFRWMVYFIMN